MRGSSGVPDEIPRAGADADGAVAPRVGRDGSAGARSGRHRTGGAAPRASRRRRSPGGSASCGRAAGWRPGRVRRPGGGRKRTIDKDPTLLRDLEGLVEPTRLGRSASRPCAGPRRACGNWPRTLQSMGHRVSHQLVAELLHAAGYSLQANQKTREGPQHPDRDAQFRHITAQVRPVPGGTGSRSISVDTKKKELVGRFQERRPGVAPGGPARAGARARLPDPRPGQGHSLRGLRPDAATRAG